MFIPIIGMYYILFTYYTVLMLESLVTWPENNQDQTMTITGYTKNKYNYNQSLIIGCLLCLRFYNQLKTS